MKFNLKKAQNLKKKKHVGDRDAWTEKKELNARKWTVFNPRIGGFGPN